MCVYQISTNQCKIISIHQCTPHRCYASFGGRPAVPASGARWRREDILQHQTLRLGAGRGRSRALRAPVPACNHTDSVLELVIEHSGGTQSWNYPGRCDVTVTSPKRERACAHAFDLARHKPRAFSFLAQQTYTFQVSASSVTFAQLMHAFRKLRQRLYERSPESSSDHQTYPLSIASNQAIFILLSPRLASHEAILLFAFLHLDCLHMKQHCAIFPHLA